MSNQFTIEDLECYIQDFSNGMRFIKHPLLNEIIFSDLDAKIPQPQKKFFVPNGYEAETFREAYVSKINYKQEWLDEAIDKENWNEVFMLIEKPYRLGWLEENYDMITDEKAYYQFLKDAWVQSEFPMSGFYDYEDLLNMFLLYDPQSMMDKDELSFYNQLPNELTIWRGVMVEKELDKENIGFSFTLDKERAEWFAKRFAQDSKGTPILIEAKVKKEEVLSVFLIRSEEEILVSPDSVKIIKIKEL